MGQTAALTPRKHWKLYIELALLSMLCVSQAFKIGIISLGITGCIIGLHFLMEDIEECTVGLFCALPVFNILNQGVGNISLYYLMVMIFWLRYFQLHEWKISKIKFMVLFILLIIRLGSGEIRDTLTWFVLFTVPVLTYGEDFFDKNLYQIIAFITASFLITTLVAYILLRMGKGLYVGGVVWTGKVVSDRFGGAVGNSVFFSQFCAFFVAANLALGCTRRKYLVPSILFVAGCMIFCIESYAKTGMLLILLCGVSSMVWFIWNRLHDKRTAVLSIFLVFAGVIGGALAINYILNNTDNIIIANYITRLSQADLLTGRGEIWAHYASMLFDDWRSLLFAQPHSEFTAYFPIARGRFFNNTHNIFLETACMFGIIPSLVMFAFVFIEMFRCLFSGKGILWQMPICVLLASGITLHGHQEFHYYTLVAIALSFLHARLQPAPSQPPYV